MMSNKQCHCVKLFVVKFVYNCISEIYLYIVNKTSTFSNFYLIVRHSCKRCTEFERKLTRYENDYDWWEMRNRNIIICKIYMLQDEFLIIEQNMEFSVSLKNVILTNFAGICT